MRKAEKEDKWKERASNRARENKISDVISDLRHSYDRKKNYAVTFVMQFFSNIQYFDVKRHLSHAVFMQEGLSACIYSIVNQILCART